MPELTNEIKRLYFDEKLSMPKIADKLKCSTGLVQYRLSKTGLKTRARGELTTFPHPNTKLTTTSVLSIREEFDIAFRKGEPINPTLIRLAKKYNTSSTNVRSILLRETWKHI